MEGIRIIEVKESIFEDNNRDAENLRCQLKEEKTFLLNLMSSPGSGKTSTLLALAEELKRRGNPLRWAVMEADIDSTVDAQTIENAGIPSIQIHTGGMCHLDADMTRQGLTELKKRMSAEEDPQTDLVILENVGNLVCPAEFDTGAVKNMTILSVPEGHDKPLKYPLMYETCHLLVVNKIDVEPYFDFDREKLVEFARKRNPDIEIIFISAKTGEGIDKLVDWLTAQTEDWIR
ncbi:MAG: hydrogenase nickel incorporation protein HypB [Firmicutes bacterium]|nr:hydrogenase nickel incorporation protein HypB [Bacillota bacterium]